MYHASEKGEIVFGFNRQLIDVRFLAVGTCQVLDVTFFYDDIEVTLNAFQTDSTLTHVERHDLKSNINYVYMNIFGLKDHNNDEGCKHPSNNFSYYQRSRDISSTRVGPRAVDRCRSRWSTLAAAATSLASCSSRTRPRS